MLVEEKYKTIVEVGRKPCLESYSCLIGPLILLRIPTIDIFLFLIDLILLTLDLISVPPCVGKTKSFVVSNVRLLPVGLSR